MAKTQKRFDAIKVLLEAVKKENEAATRRADAAKKQIEVDEAIDADEIESAEHLEVEMKQLGAEVCRSLVVP